MYWDDHYDWSREERRVGIKKMDSKTKHPFNITCRKCGSNCVVVTACDFCDLQIKCKSCGASVKCGAYHTDAYDYSDK